MLKDEDTPEDLQKDAIRGIIGSLICIVLIALCVAASHTIFYDKLDTLQARKHQNWKVIHLTNEVGLEYQVEKHRNSGHQLDIQLNGHTLFYDNCARILNFCKDVLQNTVQVTAFDFYVIDQPNTPYHILEPQLKTIYYTNEQQQDIQIEYAKRIPNHEKSIQIDKKSFIGFLILRLFLYGGLIAYLYALTPDRAFKSKFVYYPFYCVSIPMILHYLHFVVVYIIRV